MAVSHNKTVIAYSGLPAITGAFMNSYEFSYSGVIADLDICSPHGKIALDTAAPSPILSPAARGRGGACCKCNANGWAVRVRARDYALALRQLLKETAGS